MTNSSAQPAPMSTADSLTAGPKQHPTPCQQPAQGAMPAVTAEPERGAAPGSQTNTRKPAERRHRQRDPLQGYSNRDYVQHLLDPAVFTALNALPGYAVGLATTGCLDALNDLPAGSQIATVGRFYDQSLFVRGVSAAEIRQLEELSARLIAGLADDPA